MNTVIPLYVDGNYTRTSDVNMPKAKLVTNVDTDSMEGILSQSSSQYKANSTSLTITI